MAKRKSKRKSKRMSSRTPFRMVSCPGGPIVEIPSKGRFVFERLSPGTIREPDFYKGFRIIPGGRSGTKLLVACPIDESGRNGRCRVGQRVLRIWHERKELPRLIRECKNGRLKEKRASSIDRIVKDVKRMRREGSFGSLSRLASGVFAQDARTLPGRAFQFTVSAVLGTLISLFVIRNFFPGFLGHGEAVASAAAAESPVTDGLG